MKLRCLCNYCGKQWIEYVFSKEEFDKFTCSKCADTDIKIVKEDPTDYYAESPTSKDNK
jgi:hypothetical protein